MCWPSPVNVTTITFYVQANKAGPSDRNLSIAATMVNQALIAGVETQFDSDQREKLYQWSHQLIGFASILVVDTMDVETVFITGTQNSGVH